MEQDQSRIVSEFNENARKIDRLDNIYRMLRSARISGNLIKYKFDLDSLELELWTEALRLDKFKDENKKWTTQINNINEELKKPEDNNKLYYFLKEKEKILRELQQESGMGLTHKDEEEDLM